MVAPSCCLEYRPSAYLILIIFFGVFPAIYLSGKVVGTFFTVLFRVIRGIISFLYFDEEIEEPEEGAEKQTEQRESVMEEERRERREQREMERQRRREDRQRQRAARRTQEVKQTDLKAAAASNGVSNGTTQCDTYITTCTVIMEEKKAQRSDNSDSLISECEDENSQTTATTGGTVPSNLGSSDDKSAALRHRHVGHGAVR